MTPGPGIEPGTHWWKASALTTAPTLLPIAVSGQELIDVTDQVLVFRLDRGLKPDYYSGEKEEVHIKAKFRLKLTSDALLTFLLTYSLHNRFLESLIYRKSKDHTLKVLRKRHVNSSVSFADVWSLLSCDNGFIPALISNRGKQTLRVHCKPPWRVGFPH